MTDTKLKKTKVYVKTVKNTLFNKICIKEKIPVVLCILSLAAVNRNSFFCVLPLVIMQICTDRTNLYICGILSAVYYISTVVHTAFYVPCIAFILVYLAGDYMLLHGRTKAVWFAGGVFVLSKLYVLSFGYQNVYYAVFISEAVSLFFVPQILSEGKEILKSNRENLSATQLFSSAVYLFFVAASLSGISIYGFNLPVTFMFSAALYFMLKNNLSLSMIAFICMSVAICQDKNFSFLFAGFLVIYLGSSALAGKGEKGCIYTVFTAFVVSLLFITKFNSFVFLSVTSVAVAVAFAADKILTPQINCTAETTGENDYLMLTQQIEKLNRCFSFLGHTVIDISNLITKEDIPADVADIVAQKVCRRCKNNMLCWQQHYDYTQKQFSAYVHGLQSGKAVVFDDLFLSRCIKSEELNQHFDDALRLENARKLIISNGRHNQRILQNQFLTISQVLEDITRQTARAGLVNTAYTYTITKFIASMGIEAEYSICYQEKSECVVMSKDAIEADQLERIRQKLEKIYGERFSSADLDKSSDSMVYSFYQIPAYRCEFGTYSKSRYGVCGDICEMFSNKACVYVIIADGMGTGGYAAAESRTAVTMLKSLLMSEVKAETAVEIVNTALNLKGTGQSCVALDILQADMYSGKCILYKAGAAESIVFNHGKTNRMYRDSLPVGILKDTKTAKLEFTMENGSTVIMMSDGVNLGEEIICKIQIMKDSLSQEETARLVADREENTDDATAAVIKFIRQ